MVTVTVASKLSAKDKAFRKAYGHLPSECLPGCVRPRSNGQTTHRQSLTRPGDMKGMPFSETWAERKARKAEKLAGGNGPVVQVQAPTPKAPKAQAPTDGVDKAFQNQVLKLLDDIRNTVNVQDIRLNKLEAGK